MAKSYTSTIQIRCWKHHKCVGCDGNYAYEFLRKVTGTGNTEAKAAATASKNAQRAIERDTDLHPCPTCGLFQPDMIGQRRAQKAWLVFWFALIAFGVSLILGGTDVVQFNTLTWVMTAIAGCSAAVLWKANLWNPNSNVSANVERASANVASGKILHQPGDASREIKHLAAAPKSGFQMLPLVLALGAIGATAAPEILRSSRGWPVNAEAYPPVVGPGDATRIYMTEKIESIKGYWRGKADAQIREGTRSLPATTKTNQNDWGMTIHAKSSEKSSNSTPWVGVTVPADATLGGKPVSCDIKLAVEFPHMQGSSTFMTHARVMQRNVSLNLAPAGAGKSYVSLWWQSTLAGAGLTLLCSIFLVRVARAYQRTANPTKVFNADAPAEGEAPK